MDGNKISNGRIAPAIILTDVLPLSTTATTTTTTATNLHLRTNPLDDYQTSSTRDSGCYSSTADELHLMHSNSSTAKKHSLTKQRRLTIVPTDLPKPSRALPPNEPLDKIVINVSGLRFETRASTLQRYPHTLLGDKQRRAHFFDYMNNEYFFERHRSSFEAVLYFYQSGGRLTRPENISAEIFLEEIKFFDLGEEVLKRYRKQEGYVEEIPIQCPNHNLQRRVWEVFECPESSNLARVVAIISIIMIVVSIASFIIETLPSIRSELAAPMEHGHSNSSSSFHSNESPMFWIFFYIETVCVAWFSFEFICRFAVAPSKFAFIKNGPNIIDVVSIIPYFIQLIGLIYQKKDSNMSGFSSTLTVLRIVRLVRVFRIFKLSRHFKGLQVLALTFLASWKELLLLMFFLFIIVVVFSSFIYFVEADYSNPSPIRTTTTTSSTETTSLCPIAVNCLSNVDPNYSMMTTTPANNQFASIPDSFWFAIITMTTVGYGDYVPRTTLGKVIGAACAVVGVLTIALPVPIIVSNFTYFYQRQMEDNERQYQARQKAQHASQLAAERRTFSLTNEKDRGPEYNEWETTLNEPDYSDYREITHAVTKKLIHNAYFKAFRGSKKITPSMRYQNLPATVAPYQLTHRIYQVSDDKSDPNPTN